MLISYSRSGGGEGGVVDYPFFKNGKLRQGVKVLQGDPVLTKKLIKTNSNKLKYRSGIIAFEEKSPSEETIQDVIKEFIKSTFAGLNEDQYNILMVEHTNTDNYHIHFIIPRLELTTMKAFNPHWHKVDQKRLIILQDYLNAKHGLSNPFALEKRTTLKDIDLKNGKDNIKQQIHKVITNEIKKGNIQNRDEMIEFIIDSGLEVSRVSKNYITIKVENERIRFKGDFYGETFKDIRTVTESIERAEREHTTTTRADVNRLKQELDELIQHKAKRVREQYTQKQQDIINSYNGSFNNKFNKYNVNLQQNKDESITVRTTGATRTDRTDKTRIHMQKKEQLKNDSIRTTANRYTATANKSTARATRRDKKLDDKYIRSFRTRQKRKRKRKFRRVIKQLFNKLTSYIKTNFKREFREFIVNKLNYNKQLKDLNFFHNKIKSLNSKYKTDNKSRLEYKSQEKQYIKDKLKKRSGRRYK